ncbi:MAG: PaaI family thioesterase [SAR324 cluster bacterium]|nr:PaaI family thioesterase [SAR324 cluster bacterium]
MAEVLNQAGIQELLDNSPFISFMGLQVISLDPEQGVIVIKMPMRPEFERRGGTGQIHGGAIAALIDIAGDYALVMRVGVGVPTINFRTDYLRPASDQHLTATATVRQAGRSIAVVDVDVHDGNGKLIAVGRGTYSMNAG